MGTIIPRQRKDGSTGCLAQIVIKRDGKTVHRELRTFDREPAATAWIKKREKEARAPEGLNILRKSVSTFLELLWRGRVTW